MTKCNKQQSLFQALSGRKIEVDFKGGDVSSDGGVLLVNQADRRLKLTARIAKVLSDARQKSKCTHSLLHLLRQRIYGLCQGYEDLNDHKTLRDDIALQTAVGRLDRLAHQSTLCRFENTVDRTAMVNMHKVVVDTFIESYSSPPEELILDFDATDDLVHGNQEGKFFHGYYRHYCFLPLYVFCGDQLLVSYLRPSKIDASKHAGAILKLLVTRLRQAWPEVKILFRGDSGFCRDFILRWCERHQVGYVVGLAKNRRLEALTAAEKKNAAEWFEQSGEKQRLFTIFCYGAKSWHGRQRRVIAKLEHTSRGANPRFVITNRMEEDPQRLYDDLYCARGDMENRIKEQQLDLFADRTSAHEWWTNQFRLMLSSVAYTLVTAIRRIGLRGTELARAQSGTIRLKLLKIGVVLTRNTRRIRFHLSSAFPF